MIGRKYSLSVALGRNFLLENKELRYLGDEDKLKTVISCC